MVKCKQRKGVKLRNGVPFLTKIRCEIAKCGEILFLSCCQCENVPEADHMGHILLKAGKKRVTRSHDRNPKC